MSSARRSASPSQDNNNKENDNKPAEPELDENGNPIINPDATPDLQVQLFLESAGRACLYMENWFKERSFLLQERQASDIEHEAFQQSRVSEVVQVFRQERPRIESEVSNLRGEKGGIEKMIRDDFDAHQRNMKNDKENFETELHDLENQIAELTKDEQEAENWVSVQGPPARAQLQQLLRRIEEITLNTENKVKMMDSEHEEDKRDMRENLVLRLRAVRDAAAADAASAGSGGDGDEKDGNNNNDRTGADEETAALIGKPTTKTNERLTREVAVYVRESLALEHSLSNLKTQEASLSAELAQKQNANEKLVLQNAASGKTKKILESKLKELEGQLAKVEQDADRRFTERASSLVETSSQQSMIINELNDEIDLEIEKLLKLKAELREAQQQKLMQKRRARAASRFFLNCTSDFQQENACNNNTGNPFGSSKDDPDLENNNNTNNNNSRHGSTALVVTTNKTDDETTTTTIGEENVTTSKNMIMFLPTNAAMSDHGAVVSQLGKVSGKKEAAQILMRLMQRDI